MEQPARGCFQVAPEMKKNGKSSGMGDWCVEASNKTNWNEAAVEFAEFALK